ncbi:MAG: hypothetical protein ABSF38_13415 [Verrucomicrobiota bacterium]
MKRLAIPPQEGVPPLGGPAPGCGRRPGSSLSRCPMLYLANLRWTLGHPQRRDKALWQK